MNRRPPVSRLLRRVARAVALASGITTAALPATARAEPPASDDAARLEELTRVLAEEERTEERFRQWALGLDLGEAALNIGVGSYVLGRKHTVPGLVLLGQGAIHLGAAAFALWGPRTEAAQIRETILARQRAGASAGEALDAGERAWKEKVAALERKRRIFGGIGIGAGVALTTLGAVIALEGVQFPSSATRTDDRALIGGLFLGLGGLTLAGGLHTVLVPEPIETAWSSYRSIRPAASPLAWSVAPVNGGGYLSLQGSF